MSCRHRSAQVHHAVGEQWEWCSHCGAFRISREHNWAFPDTLNSLRELLREFLGIADD